MTSKLSLNIFRFLRKGVRSTSLRRLEQRGLKHVSVLDVRELKGFIQDAVDHTLSEFGITLSEEDLNRINEQAREQVLQLIADRDQLQESVRAMEKEMAELRKNFHLLQNELEVSNRLLKNEESREIDKATVPISHERIDQIESALKSRLTELFYESAGSDELRERAIEVALGLIEEERDLAFENAKTLHSQKIENLKRRINKLNTKLKETEGLLERVKSDREKGGGIPSEFKEAQGLSAEEAYYQEKKALLKEIFELNMDLKRLMAER